MEKENENSSQFFKVWDSHRKKKVFVVAKGCTNIYEQVILKASAKLNINGVSLVVEKDGTLLEDDDELFFVKNEPIILLEKDQCWISEDSISTSLSTATTETVSSVISRTEFGEDSFSELDSMPLVLVDHNSEMCWQQFAIWSSLPQRLIDDLEKGIRSSTLISEVVRNVVNAMREVKTNLPCKAFKIIASRMVAKYTTTFQAHDEDNVVLGNGHEALYTKLLDRNNYLNRPNKRRYLLETPSKKIKLIANARVGCPNWQPPVNSVEEAQEKKRLMKTLPDEDPQIIDFIKQTFPLQRQFINSNPKTIIDIFEEWPGLFTEIGILTHFQMLTKINPLEIGIIEKSKKIINFGKHKKMEIDIENEDLVMSALKVVAQYFKEDISKVIYKLKNVRFENIPDNFVQILAPSIIEMENEDTTITYAIQVEKKRIGPVTSFPNAFLIAFSLYFNFNLCYPKQCACTFEFVQRYFFKIHQESGTKSLAKNVKNKVFNFITKIANLYSVS